MMPDLSLFPLKSDLTPKELHGIYSPTTTDEQAFAAEKVQRPVARLALLIK